MLDLNDVAIFIHVVRAGSFAGASRRLGVPSNTLSRRLVGLEESLGTRLLIRSTRKLNLTSAGSAFFAQCVEGIADIEQAGQSLLEATAEPSGMIRITAPIDFFDHFPLTWIAEFMGVHSKVHVSFLLDDRRVDMIDESIDIAFRAGRLEGATLVARKLVDNFRGLFASPDFVTGNGKPVSVEQLIGYECITSPHLSEKTTWRLRGPGGEAEVEVNGRFKANTAKTQVQAARAGLGIALLPIAIVALDVAEGRLVRILPDYSLDVGGLYIVSPSSRLRAPAVSMFIEFVADKFNSAQQSH